MRKTLHHRHDISTAWKGDCHKVPNKANFILLVSQTLQIIQDDSGQTFYFFSSVLVTQSRLLRLTDRDNYKCDSEESILNFPFPFALELDRYLPNLCSV